MNEEEHGELLELKSAEGASQWVNDVRALQRPVFGLIFVCAVVALGFWGIHLLPSRFDLVFGAILGVATTIVGAIWGERNARKANGGGG